MQQSNKSSKVNTLKTGTGGFTIAEALVAIIILLLVSAVVAAGIPAAGRAYNNVVIASNSEVLLSTTMTALRNELATARDVKIVDGGDAVQYYNTAFGSISKLSKDSSDTDSKGNILYQRYYSDEELIGAYVPLGEAEAVSLVSNEASGKDLIVTYDKVQNKSKDSVIYFTNLRVIKKTTKQVISKAEKYSIRVVSESVVPEENEQNKP